MGNVILNKKPIAKTHPKIASQWHPTKNKPLKPNDFTYGSHKKVWWVCKEGHEWEAIISKRTRGHGCPYCSNHRVSKENSLAFVNPNLSLEWNYKKNRKLTPNDVVTGSHKKVWWVCNKSHEWEASIKNRFYGRGCPYCSNRKVTKSNSLAFVNPNLSKQWNYKKNGKLTPNDVIPGSEQKVWWICKRAHEWEAMLDSRNRGSGCPYCSNRKVANSNSLAFVNPNLASEWHYQKNGKLTPKDVVFGSAKKVWWICKRGHEWEASIANRSKGIDCPFCKRQVSKAETRIFSELKFLFLDTISRTKVNEYESDIYIPSLKISIEYDGYWWHKNKETKDLAKSHLFLKHGIIPIRIREIGLKRITKYDIINQPDIGIQKYLINKILSKILKYKKISNNKLIVKINKYFNLNTFANNKHYNSISYNLNLPLKNKSLKYLFPKLVKEWNYKKNGFLNPENYSKGSSEIVWWVCNNGHEWETSILQRTNKGTGCPYCSNRKVTKENSFAFVKPKLAFEWNYKKNEKLTPNDVVFGSNKKVWWVCNKGHEWEAIIESRTRGNNCPYCANKKVSISNSLAFVHTNLSKEWNYKKNGKLTPNDFVPGSHKKVWWICNKGHEWEAVIFKRTSGNSCPFCSNKKVTKSNSLAFLNPILSKEWNYKKNVKLTPNHVVPGSHKKVWWICKNKHIWNSRIVDRTYGKGCRVCYNLRRSKNKLEKV